MRNIDCWYFKALPPNIHDTGYTPVPYPWNFTAAREHDDGITFIDSSPTLATDEFQSHDGFDLPPASPMGSTMSSSSEALRTSSSSTRQHPDQRFSFQLESMPTPPEPSDGSSSPDPTSPSSEVGNFPCPENGCTKAFDKAYRLKYDHKNLDSAFHDSWLVI